MKKEDYYTTSSIYEDLDGNLRSFTKRSFDKKASVTTLHQEDVSKKLEEYRLSLVKRIMEVPASLSPHQYVQYTTRGEGVNFINWKEDRLLQESIDVLRPICTILENIYGNNNF